MWHMHKYKKVNFSVTKKIQKSINYSICCGINVSCALKTQQSTCASIPCVLILLIFFVS